MNDKPKCGCEKCKKYRKMAGIAECFENKANALGIFEAYTFQKNKPFKVTFNEDINVTWNSVSEEKDMTSPEKKERERIVKGMKKENGKDFEKRYPGRGKEVMYATATKLAMEETEMTEKDLEQKDQYMGILKAKMPEFTKRYGKKARDVMGGVAAKLAIRKPD
jgi:hypothetical protein